MNRIVFRCNKEMNLLTNGGWNSTFFLGGERVNKVKSKELTIEMVGCS